MSSQDMPNLGAVRALIDQHASFTFDVVQYLQSLKHTDYLRARAELYQQWQAGTIAAPLTKDAVLHELCQSLAKTVPAYQHYSLAPALEDLPLISKRDLQVEGNQFVQRDTDGHSIVGDLWHTTTFGTTAAPVSVFYSPAFYFEYLHLSIWKLTNCFLGKATDNGVFALCIDDNPDRPEFVTLDPSGMTGVMVRVFVDKMRGDSFARAFSLIEDMRPAVVATRPSLFEALMAYAQVEKLFLDVGIRCVFSAGSFLTEETKHEVERVFGAPVLNCYGLAEFGYVAGECEHQCGYHIDETSVLVELLDAAGIPVPDNTEGEVIVSGTVNEAMPLIRFRTGDFSALDRRPCSCGSRSPRLMYIKGHGPFHYRFSDGNLLHPARLYPIAWLFPLRDFQVIEEAPDKFHIRIDPDETAPGHIADEIGAYMRGVMPSGSTVHVSVCNLEGNPNFNRFMPATPPSLVGRD